ncbi:MAG: tetratricopeptide repeat protein, partial [Pyrinomonadaceae bacterium]|nr:tetratricopeptide repeat protein [Pyrinomonadaceae bacterium]
RYTALSRGLGDVYKRQHIQSTIEWNWEAAEESLRTAIRLFPNSPNAHHRLAMLYLKLRRYAEAENELNMARRLDPTSLSVNMNLGVIYCFSGRNAEAIAQFKKTVDLDQRFMPVRWYIARCEMIGGRVRESLSAFQNVLERAGDTESAEIIRKGIDTMPPENIFAELAESWKKRIGPTRFNPHDIALIEALSGDAEQAVYWLERSAEERHPWASWINCEPEFEFLRNNDRFNALLTKMNLRQP